MHPARAACRLRLFEIENRSTRRDFFTAKGKPDEFEPSSGQQHRHRAVRGSEVDSEKHLFLVGRAHLLIIRDQRPAEEIANGPCQTWLNALETTSLKARLTPATLINLCGNKPLLVLRAEFQ
jgi:hypothetical protein